MQDVLVGGWPWRIRVEARVLVSGSLSGGERYQNTVFPFMTLIPSIGWESHGEVVAD